MSEKEARLHALERQVQRLQRRLDALRRTQDRYATVRLVVFLVGAVAVWSAFFFGGAAAGLVAGGLAVAAFSLAVRTHRRVRRGVHRHEAWLRIKQGHVARIRLNWAALPRPRAAAAPREHPFAADLDLVGERSLHRLMDTAQSHEGSMRLLAWLLNTEPDLETIRRRQALVQELLSLPRLPDRLALQAMLAADDPGAPWHSRRLLDWLERRATSPRLRLALFLLLVLSAANLALLGLDALDLLPPLWAVTLPVYGAVYAVLWRAVGDLFADTLYLADALRRLSAVLGYLERYPLGGRRGLEALCAPLRQPGARPSRYLRRVSRLASAASVQGNPPLWLLVNAVLPWDLICADRLGRLKAELAARLPAWLDVWFELEALGSLATFSYLNPEYTFPEVLGEGSGPALRGQALGHPLIPFPEKVCNDFALETPGEVVLITGSNMSGKSSFLRTVGVNLCLACAGSVVNAAALQVRLFRLFTCIHVTDSVTDGISYFYAEVRRLKALLAALEADHPLPLFFLIDEIFRGTNNRERLIGSRAYVRALTERGGTGLIATHDLELVHLAEDNPRIRNVHFRETVQDGRMHFDYRLRPGPCPTTNALVIMRLEGLPVDPEAASSGAECE